MLSANSRIQTNLVFFLFKNYNIIKRVINKETLILYAVPGVRRGEGINSDRLFTPGERKALVKSKVHQ
jgi:hypothetical protein